MSRKACSYGWNSKLFVYNKNKKLAVHDLVSGQHVCYLGSMRVKNTRNVWPALSEDDKRVLVPSPDKDGFRVQWFDSRRGHELGRLHIAKEGLFPERMRPFEWYANDGSLFGYITHDSRLALVDCRRRKVVQVIGIPVPPPDKSERPLFPAWRYEQTANANFILASRESETVPGRHQFALWDWRTGGLIRHFYLRPTIPKGDQKEYWERRISPDGRLMAVHVEYSDELIVYETASRRPRGRIRAPNQIHDFSFAPDGKTLATSGSDTTILIWDMNRPLSGRPIPKLGQTPAELDHTWNQLGELDAAAAEPAIWALVRSPKFAQNLLRERLKLATPLDPNRIQALIAKLDARSFKVRESAVRELTKIGERVAAALRSGLNKMTLEQRLRAEELLVRLEDPAKIPVNLRELRAIEVLERIGSADARRLLKRIANGTPDALQTREARLALERLAPTKGKKR